MQTGQGSAWPYTTSSHRSQRSNPWPPHQASPGGTTLLIPNTLKQRITCRLRSFQEETGRNSSQEAKTYGHWPATHTLPTETNGNKKVNFKELIAVERQRAPNCSCTLKMWDHGCRIYFHPTTKHWTVDLLIHAIANLGTPTSGMHKMMVLRISTCYIILCSMVLAHLARDFPLRFALSVLIFVQQDRVLGCRALCKPTFLVCTHDFLTPPEILTISL